MTTHPYLASIPQWVAVLLVWNDRKRKWDKLPCSPGLTPADAHDSRNWLTYDAALALVTPVGHPYTLGFVLTAQDDLFCLDIDGSLQDDGSWSPLTQQLYRSLPGCYVETSLSGKGIHIWGRYANPPQHRKKRVDLGIELYSSARFIAIGTPLAGDFASVCAALPALIAQVFPPVESTPGSVPDEGPRADWRGPPDDDELLRRAMQARSMANVFGARASFADLWLADDAALARAYPSSADSLEPYDRSSADAALAAHLGFWTGCDVARIERLMRRSKLARPKWDERHDYLVQRTIVGQCLRQRDVLQDRPMEPLVVGAPAAPPAIQFAATQPQPPSQPGTHLDIRAVEGSTFLSPAQQVELFKGCVYVQHDHKVLLPNGRMITPDRFRARFGGYTFVMDGRNERVSRNAFEAFTESQAVRAPRADNVCFKPRLPFGTIIASGGEALVNTFTGISVERRTGDTRPFHRQLELLVPDAYERKVVLYYMAACVQRVGHKAQWALVLQGCEGNGKSFLASCVAEAIGPAYTYWPRASLIGSQFNAWLVGRLLYVIEELMVNGRQELMDVLKPLITSTGGIEIERKGQDQFTADICGNFLCTTNHKNAVLKTRNDRRWCMVQTAQQDVSDLSRDGMTGRYLPDLYTWARSGGYAAVSDMLHTVEIPAEFDFTRDMHRAPITRSTERVIADSLGPVEQEIVDAVEREEIGFRGGWISSQALDKLLQRTGKDRTVSHAKRREILLALGYDWHPALVEGRVDNPVMPDAAKVKLFVRRDDERLRALWRRPDVAAEYTRAQGAAAVLAAPSAHPGAVAGPARVQ